MICTDLTTIGGRVWAVRSAEKLSRRAFAEKLGCQEMEIKNIEFNKLKKPEQKESLYRNIAATFNVSLDWIKTGEGSMREPVPLDKVSRAYDSLKALHDPLVDGFILWLETKTEEEKKHIADGLREILNCMDSTVKKD